MLTHLQLVAYTASGTPQRLTQISLTGDLQTSLQQELYRQHDSFCNNIVEIPFDAGYKPESNERFVIQGYNLPESIDSNREGINTLNNFRATPVELSRLTAIIAYAKRGLQEIVMIQRFTRSQVIQEGRYLFVSNDTFQRPEGPCLALAAKPDAVFFPAERKLLFANFRNANSILPLSDFYEEASEAEIRQILTHDRLSCENIDALAVDASQWFRTRFSMLRDSRVLDNHSSEQIRNNAVGYLDIQLQGDGENACIVFPSDKSEAKKLLQFLNEELYKGPITDKLYETNSKREAD